MGAKEQGKSRGGLTRAEAGFSGESGTGGKGLAYNQGAYKAVCEEDMSWEEAWKKSDRL